jgi:hypothetical protein
MTDDDVGTELEMLAQANGPPPWMTADYRACRDRGCRWEPHDQRWTRHATGCPNTKAKMTRARRPAGPTRRKLRPDDIGGLLVDVGKAAADDPRLTDVDRDVYFALFGRAHGLTETEITAPIRWLAGVTGHRSHLCQTALGRLDRFGYVTRIYANRPADDPLGVRRQKLRNWLAGHTFEQGRLPGLYRMSLNPPRWDEVPDFAAPLEDGWRDRVDALLSV